MPRSIRAAVSISLGVYAPSTTRPVRPLFTLGFSGTLNMKAWLTTLVLVLAFVQMILVLRLYGKIGGGPPQVGRPDAPAGRDARVPRDLAVAYHCLWSLGFEADPDKPGGSGTLSWGARSTGRPR